jgi:putative glutamine amidotransferase
MPPENKRPLIGVIPLWDSSKDSLWMLPGYMDGLVEAGALPVMLPLTMDVDMIRDIVNRFDGFLLTGGQDVSPGLYSEARHEKCGETCATRDTMESLLVRSAVSADKPLFGICRGIQFLNALFGGTLYQDIPAELPSELRHAQKPPYDLPAHSVKVFGCLGGLLGKDNLEVHSHHHQGIRRLSPGLKPCATAPDGLIEAAYMPGKRFVLAVQWHPECALRWESSRKLFSAFVDACKKQ